VIRPNLECVNGYIHLGKKCICFLAKNIQCANFLLTTNALYIENIYENLILP
jgi:hypothetical protein